MKKEEFLAVTPHAFRKSEIDSKLSLFILGTDTVTNTVLMELLSKELEDKDGRFCLAVSDFRSLQHSFPEIAADVRVKLVMEDSYEFIRALSEARRIFTVWYLPNYYVKKEGQIVYELNSESRLLDKSAPQVKMYNYARMINNTDYFIRDGFYEELYVDRHPEAERLSVLLPSNHYNPNREIKQLRRAKSKVKKGRVIFGVSTAAWDCCKKLEDIEPELIRDVYPFTHSLNEIFEKASVIASSNDGVIAIAESSGKSCVFYGSTKEELSENTVRCFDLSEAAEEGYKLLAKRSADASARHAPKGCDSASVDLNDFVPCSGKGAKKRILIAADWADRNKCVYLHQFVEKISEKDELSIDFLFHDEDRREAAKEAQGPIGEISAYFVEGMHQCRFEDLPASEDDLRHLDPAIYDIRSEWKRTLGDAEYDELWLMTGTEFPLGEAHKYAPARKVRKLNKDELTDSLIGLSGDFGEGGRSGKAGNSDKTGKRLSLEKDSDMCVLDGEEFFTLGSMDVRDYYISRKTAEQPYVLVKYDAAKADNIKQAIAGLGDKEAAVIVINPSNKKVSDIVGSRRMIEIPAEFAAPELIGSCELFITAEGEIERAAAGIMSVPVQLV